MIGYTNALSVLLLYLFQGTHVFVISSVLQDVYSSVSFFVANAYLIFFPFVIALSDIGLLSELLILFQQIHIPANSQTLFVWASRRGCCRKRNITLVSSVRGTANTVLQDLLAIVGREFSVVVAPRRESRWIHCTATFGYRLLIRFPCHCYSTTGHG
jgi:hypothetical protein